MKDPISNWMFVGGEQFQVSSFKLVEIIDER